MFDIEVQSSFDSDRLAALIAKQARGYTEDVAIDLGAELQEKTPVAFGDAQRGWDVESEGKGLNFSTTVSNDTEAAYYRIVGRGPGKAPPAGPGSNLERWARLKGLRRGASFGIAKKIGRVGTDRWRSRRNALGIDPITQELRPSSPVREAQDKLRKLMQKIGN